MIRRPPRSTLFPYTNALPIYASGGQREKQGALQENFWPKPFSRAPRCAPLRLPWKIAHPLARSEEHTSELQSHLNIVCRLLLEKKNKNKSKVETLQTVQYLTR